MIRRLPKQRRFRVRRALDRGAPGAARFLALCAVALMCVLPSRASAGTAGKYVRYVESSEGGAALEASIVRFVRDDGATVDLIAAVHVADAAYFRLLDGEFRGYDALLYEMVKPTGAPMPPRGQASGHWVGRVQRALAETLELSHQLDEIDYTAANMVHADLDAAEFTRLQRERRESMMSLLVRAMARDFAAQVAGDGASRPPGGGELLLALSSPDRAGQLKRLLARQFHHVDSMVEGLDGPDGSVILTERNRVAFRALQRELANGKRRLGVFFGAAHLSGIEAMMRGDLGFRQEGEPRWLVAWRIDAGASPATRPLMQR